jgi:hypothetical protein
MMATWEFFQRTSTAGSGRRRLGVNTTMSDRRTSMSTPRSPPSTRRSPGPCGIVVFGVDPALIPEINKATEAGSR